LKFHAPNDVVVKSDGTIWFTDPDYSSPGTTLVPKSVYRYTPSPVSLTAMVTTFDEPNGLCFSPDESKLYIGDSGTNHKIRVYTVASDNSLDAGTDFKVFATGAPDGIRCDRDGRIFSSADDGVRVFLPDGTHIGTILTPVAHTVTNLCFGGADGKTLFITAQDSLFSVHLNTLGTGVASGNPLPASGGGGGGGGGGCGLLGFEAALVLIVRRLRRAASRPASR